MSSNRKLTIVSWNVRGLGEEEKCIVVRDTLVTCHPSVACIQETKLSSISPPKFRSFLPANLRGHCFLAANGSRGGVATTWDDSQLALLSADICSFSVTTTLTTTLSDLTFTLTNVYSPSDHQQTPAFLDELKEIAGVVTAPGSSLLTSTSSVLLMRRTIITSMITLQKSSTWPSTASLFWSCPFLTDCSPGRTSGKSPLLLALIESFLTRT